MQRNFSQAVRLGDLKAIRLDPGGPIEVYNLRLDPGEQRNVAAEHPDFVAWAGAIFRTARTENEHWPLKPPKKGS